MPFIPQHPNHYVHPEAPTGTLTKFYAPHCLPPLFCCPASRICPSDPTPARPAPTAIGPKPCSLPCRPEHRKQPDTHIGFRSPQVPRMSLGCTAPTHSAYGAVQRQHMHPCPCPTIAALFYPITTGPSPARADCSAALLASRPPLHACTPRLAREATCILPHVAATFLALAQPETLANPELALDVGGGHFIA